MTAAEGQAKSINGDARTVRELLNKAKYAIEFHQRAFAWRERQIRKPIDDLAGHSLDSYEAGQSRHQVAGYGRSIRSLSDTWRTERLAALPTWPLVTGGSA